MSEVVGNKNTKKNTNKSTANAKVRKKSVEIESVSLKEIKEVIQNKVKDNQKQNVVKKVLVNIGIAIVMIVYLLIVMLGTKNIDIIVLKSLCSDALSLFHKHTISAVLASAHDKVGSYRIFPVCRSADHNSSAGIRIALQFFFQ